MTLLRRNVYNLAAVLDLNGDGKLEWSSTRFTTKAAKRPSTAANRIRSKRCSRSSAGP